MSSTPTSAEIERLREKIRKLERMNTSMMDRIERSNDSAGNAYAMFEANILMQQLVRDRTHEARAAAERLAFATENAGIGIWEWDIHTGILRWDDAMYRLYGIESGSEAVTLESWQKAIHPDDRDRSAAMLQKATKGQCVYDTTFRISRPDGRVRHIRAFARIVTSPDSQAAKMLGVNYDITEQILSQSQLEHMNEILKQTAAISKTGGWRLDIRDGVKSLYWTDEVKRIHEVPRDYEPTLETAINFYAPEARATIAEAVQAGIDHGKGWDLVLPFVTAKGRKLWVRAMGRVVQNSGQNISIAGAFQDVTDYQTTRIDLEQATIQAQAASAAKSEFLANMSHEIRTPMTAIVGFSELLENEPEIASDPDLLRDAVHSIRNNANHLLRIINDILDMSKIEAGRLSIEFLETDPLEIVHEIAGALRSIADSKNLELSVITEGAIPSRFITDPTRLKQVLHNLVGNALKFTESGSVRVRIGSVQPDNRLCIAVEDTGIGMSDEQLRSILNFTAFNQADSSTTRRFGGTGLGLRISESLAEMLGGTLTIESQPGIGSVVTLTVPMGRPQLNQSAGDSLLEGRPDLKRFESHKETHPLCGMRILLAEDGRDNQKLITHHLRKAGALVTIASNGREAIEAVASRTSGEDFSVILMDMQMPEVDGYQATRALKQNGCRTPILALTAHAMQGDRERCINAGCDGYLTKPIEAAHLVDTCAIIGGNVTLRKSA